MTRDEILDDFAVFILTHGRPDRVRTFETLIKAGYRGRIYIVVDNMDKTVDKYRVRFNERVVVFDKLAVSKTFDNADNFKDFRAIVYARNASFQIAKDLGIKYFIQLDDDYTNFQYRFDENLNYQYKGVKDLDRVFAAMLRFLIRSGVSSLAMSQGGDFIGGGNSSNAKSVSLKRKCMNSFICSTDRPFQFVGRINEDVNTYTRAASVGLLLFTTNQVCLVQVQTQSNSGGMTDIYLDSGTYVKSFYTVIFQPSSVKIRTMGSKNGRLHHSINWKNTVPMIVSESLRK